MHIIILAAGQGKRLRPITNEKPKCLVKVGGRTILDRIIDSWSLNSETKPVVVGGYKIEKINNKKIIKLNNTNYRNTNMLQTLMLATDYFKKCFVMSYGDIFYDSKVLTKLLKSNGDINVVVDNKWREYWEMRFKKPLDDAETLKIKNGYINEIGNKAMNIEDIDSQYIGLIFFKERGIKILRKYYKLALEFDKNKKNPFNGSRSLKKMYMTDLLQAMIKGGERLTAIEINRGWFEIDSNNDIAVAESLLMKEYII